MAAGRPKLQKSKNIVLHVRVTEEELAEIEKVAQKFKITKTEAILRGIKNLSQVQPVYYRSQMPNFKPNKLLKNADGILPAD